MASPAANAPDPNADARHAWRVAVATTLCLVLVECWHLPHASLAVWTTYMVMVQWTFTIFQKGVERIVGRVLGIVAGLVLIAAFPDAWAVRILVEVILLTTLFYFYFANWLAYTFLNAGLYLIVIVELGHQSPELAHRNAVELSIAVIVGVVVADVVTWLTGAEGDLRIQANTDSLLPIRSDWLNHSAMLVATALLTLALTRWLGLPTEKAVFSVFLMAVAPHVQAALRKGEFRLLGALYATIWAVATFALVSRLPHFVILAAMLFFGILICAYLARIGGTYSYIGVQMGLVLPLLIVVPIDEFGDLDGAWQRVQGILAAVAATLLVATLWPAFPLVEAPAETAQR